MPAAMAGRIYPFPFRTRKSSAPAPMILPTGGKVGRRRLFLFSFCAPPLEGLFFFLPRALPCLALRAAQPFLSFGSPGLTRWLPLIYCCPAAFGGMACPRISVRAGRRFLASSPLSCSCAVPAGLLPVPAGLSGFLPARVRSSYVCGDERAARLFPLPFLGI